MEKLDSTNAHRIMPFTFGLRLSLQCGNGIYLHFGAFAIVDITRCNSVLLTNVMHRVTKGFIVSSVVLVLF